MGGGGQKLAFHLVHFGLDGDVPEIQNLGHRVRLAAAQPHLQYPRATPVDFDHFMGVWLITAGPRAQARHARERRAGRTALGQPGGKLALIQAIQRHVVQGRHLAERRVDVRDPPVLVKRDKAIRAHGKNGVELLGALQLALLGQAACGHVAARVQQVAGERAGQRHDQHGGQCRLQPHGLAGAVVVGQHVVQGHARHHRQIVIGDLAVVVHALNAVDHRALGERARELPLGDPREHGRPYRVAAKFGLVAHLPGAGNAVQPIERRHAVSAQLEFAVKAGEIAGVNRHHHHAGERPIGVIDAPRELHRPFARGSANHRFGDEEFTRVGGHMHAEMLAV